MTTVGAGTDRHHHAGAHPRKITPGKVTMVGMRQGAALVATTAAAVVVAVTAVLHLAVTPQLHDRAAARSMDVTATGRRQQGDLMLVATHKGTRNLIAGNLRAGAPTSAVKKRSTATTPKTRAQPPTDVERRCPQELQPGMTATSGHNDRHTRPPQRGWGHQADADEASVPVGRRLLVLSASVLGLS